MQAVGVLRDEQLEDHAGLADLEAMHRHGVQHLVGDHQAAQLRGEIAQPVATPDEARQLLAQARTLTLSQVRTRLENAVAIG